MLTIALALAFAIAGSSGCQRSPPPSLNRTSVSRSPREIRGRVIDDDGPVSGAAVRVKGRPEAVLSDASGNFILVLPDAVDPHLTASRTGYFIAGVDARDSPLIFRLRPIPEDDDPHYVWVRPQPDEMSEQACGNCHPAILREWQETGHARSATGSFLRDLLFPTRAPAQGTPGRDPDDWSLADDLPDGVEVCASCHAPSRDSSAATSVDEQPFPGDWGVHCDFCHKVADVSLEHLGHSHGVFAMELRRPREGQLFFGPLEDVDRGDESALPLQRESKLCAPCHEGTLFGVPVYTTYGEWLDSPAAQQGKQCQTCHMAPTGTMTRLATGEDAIDRDPRSLGSHDLLPGGVGAMLRRAVQTRTAVRRRAATRDVSAGTEVQVRLVASDVGHRVPTGFIDRHLLLVVDAFNAEGLRVPLDDGPRLPSAAGVEMSGRPGRLFARLLSDPNGNEPAPFWRPGATVRADTRLQPEVPVVVDFKFGASVTEVRVRLLYRRFWDQVTRAKGWPDETIVVFDERTEVSDR